MRILMLSLTKYILFICLAFSLTFSPFHAHAFFFGGISLKDEKEMGRKFDVMMRSSMPIIEDPEIKYYMDDVLERLKKAMPPQPYEFKASVILHNALNAFAVPGGFVFVFSGMLMNLNNEAELAGVLAHELAHVTHRHVSARMERAQYLTLGSLLLAVAGIALGGPAGAPIAATATGASQSAMLNYSRLDESDADNTGLQYLVKAGYPPSAMAGGFKILRQKNWMSGVNIPTYLSTHPAIGDRVNTISARAAAMPEHIRNQSFDNTRFKRVQTLLWARYGDTQSALHRFSGKDGLSQMGRGMVLSRMNRVKEAATAFENALQASPDDPLVLRQAGIFHFRKGDMAKAENLLKKAMQKDRKDYMASFYYARLLDETGRSKNAPAYYRDVLRSVPQDPEVHEAFGRSLGQAGDNYNAYIHLAYGAMYANNKKLTERYLKQARELGKNRSDLSALNRLENIYKERKEIWDKS